MIFSHWIVAIRELSSTMTIPLLYMVCRYPKRVEEERGLGTRFEDEELGDDT